MPLKCGSCCTCLVQEDHFLPQLTVQEVLMFHAVLTLPTGAHVLGEA